MPATAFSAGDRAVSQTDEGAGPRVHYLNSGDRQQTSKFMNKMTTESLSSLSGKQLIGTKTSNGVVGDQDCPQDSSLVLRKESCFDSGCSCVLGGLQLGCPLGTIWVSMGGCRKGPGLGAGARTPTVVTV